MWKIYSFQLYGTSVYPITSGLIGIPPVCPLIARNWHRDCLLSKQYSILVLLLPCWIRWIQYLSENYAALSCANSNSNSDLTVSQWNDPSCARSSWSYWQTIFVSILDTLVRKPLLVEGFTSIVIHFRSPLGVIVFLNKESPIRLLGGLAQVSLMLLGAHISLLLLDPLSAVSNSLLDLSSSLWSWISFTNRSVSLDITSEDVRRFNDWRNRIFYPISIKNFHNLNFQNWSNDCAFGNTTWDSTKDRENVYSQHGGVTVLQPSSPSGRILYFFAAVTRHIGSKLFSHNCVSSILLANASKLKTFSRILFPGANVGGDTESCTSSGCKLVNILLATDKLARPFSSSVRPKCWHQFTTAP